MPKQRDFLEEITKLQKLLDIGLKQSKQNKKERTPKEEQKQRELEEEND